MCDPDAILSAAFCIVWSLAIAEGEEFGNQMGAAYVAIDLISALYVMVMVSFCWPQEEPARDLRMLRRDLALSLMEFMWGVKV